MSVATVARRRPISAWLLLGLLCRLALAAVLTSVVAQRYEVELVTKMLPAIAAEFEWLDDTYAIQKIYLNHEGADRVVRVVVSQTRCVVFGDLAFCGDPRGRASASTLLGNITLPTALLVAVVCAWPVVHAAEYLLRALFLPIALAVIWALDVPFILLSEIWGLQVDAFAPGLFSPLLVWSQFLQGGGRILLTLLLFMTEVFFARRCVAWLVRSMAS